MSRIDPEKLLRIRDARPSAKHERLDELRSAQRGMPQRRKTEELVHDLDSQKENLTAEDVQALRDLRLVKLLASAQRDRKGPKGQIDKETLRRFVTEDLSISETHRVEEILKSDPAQLDAYLAARLEDVGDRAPKPDEYLLRRVRAQFLGGAQEHAEAPNGSFGNRAKAMFEWLGLGTTGRQVAFAAQH